MIDAVEPNEADDDQVDANHKTQDPRHEKDKDASDQGSDWQQMGRGDVHKWTYSAIRAESGLGMPLRRGRLFGPARRCFGERLSRRNECCLLSARGLAASNLLVPDYYLPIPSGAAAGCVIGVQPDFGVTHTGHFVSPEHNLPATRLFRRSLVSLAFARSNDVR